MSPQEEKQFEEESRRIHAFFVAHRDAWKPSRSFAEKLSHKLSSHEPRWVVNPVTWRWIFAVPVGVIAILLMLQTISPQDQASPIPSLLQENSTKSANDTPPTFLRMEKDAAGASQEDTTRSFTMQTAAPIPDAPFEIFLTKTSENSCIKTYPLPRTIKSTGDVNLKGMLEILINGPTKEELSQGFRTSLNSAIKIETLVVHEGNIIDVILQEPDGLPPHTACELTRIRTQIETTLRQFPGADTVNISLNDKPIP